MLLKALHHLYPVIREDVRPSAARLVAELSIRFRADDDSASASVSTPEIDASEKGFVLLARKATRELDAELFEELHGIYVGKTFESSAHDRPHHAQRLDAGMATLGVDRLRFFLQLWIANGWSFRFGCCGGTAD